MGKKFHNLFKKQQKSDSLLTEFGESLLLIVDPEQLRNNLLSKLRELINVEKGELDIPANTYQQIDFGYSYAIGLDTDGYIWGWGDEKDYNTISHIPDGNNFVQIDSGWYHAIALTNDGNVIQWGSRYDTNDSNELDSWYFTGTDIVKIDSLYYHNIALTSDASATLTIDVSPNDVNTTTPLAGQHDYYIGQKVYLNAPEYLKCPFVWEFDHWEGDIDEPNDQTQFITLSGDKTITAVYTEQERLCGDLCHPILEGDLNGDCYINFVDFGIFCEKWLSCTHPDCDPNET
ncbi:MAG: hypothetical protein ACYTE8_02940 [Planctomycetota bacterium]